MKICFVASRFPYPINKGDTLRAYHQIRELSREHSVHLVAACETAVDAEALAEMQKYCSGIDVVQIGKARSLATVASRGLGSRLPLQVLYFLSPALAQRVRRVVAEQHFDVIHAMTIRVAPAVFTVATLPIVLDFMDSYAANIATRREHVGPVVRRLYDVEFSRVAGYEREAARRADGGVVIAELDRASIGEPRLAVVPNGVDLNSLAFSDRPREPEHLVFTGNMGYQPNIDAVTWFVENCWPTLRSRVPDLRLSIVGARPAPAVVALGRAEGVEIVGPVESMEPYLHRAAIAICPIRCGSGMQNKILEAMSAGAPVVTTAFANRSIAAQAGTQIGVAADNDGHAFATEVLALLENPALARRQALAARQFVESRFAWSGRAAQLVDVYRQAREQHAARISLGEVG